MFFDGLKRRREVTYLLVAGVDILDSLSVSSLPSFNPSLCVSLNLALIHALKASFQVHNSMVETSPSVDLEDPSPGEGLRDFPIHWDGCAVGGSVGRLT